jgi:isopenicillin-N epimerase
VPDRSPFLLDPSVVYLNHGSYGACPAPVFEAYQRWQRTLQRQPVEFLQRRVTDLLAETRSVLAAFVGAERDDIVMFPNPTTALNMVARSLDLRPGDEILSTDHEYGALDRTWRFVCERTGARYVQAVLPVPFVDVDDVVERITSLVSDRTRILFVSHITSATAVRLPVEPLVAWARARGLLTIVDGAHVPGHLPLDVGAIGADVYVGACHKWMCAPPGSTFLHARCEVQDQLDPLVVSWGWEAADPGPSRFVDHHEWQGTRDMAAFLAVRDAVEWIGGQDWSAQRQRSHARTVDVLDRLDRATGEPSRYPVAAVADDPATWWFGQMAVATLPARIDGRAFQQRLWDEHRIEIPVQHHHGRDLLRVSVAPYTTDEDLDVLVDAVTRQLDR